MSGPTFPPSGDVAEINRIHYDLEYTEGISQRMRIPETLKVAPDSEAGPIHLQQPGPPHATLMQVPERIIVAGEIFFVRITVNMKYINVPNLQQSRVLFYKTSLWCQHHDARKSETGECAEVGTHYKIFMNFS